MKRTMNGRAKASRNGRARTWRTWTLAALCLIASLGGAQAAELAFPAGSQTGGDGTLAIGDSLRVGATGLRPGAAADLLLRNPQGEVVTRLEGRADANGNLPLAVLWLHTGVVGCDCTKKPGLSRYEFLTHEMAEQALGGSRWSVDLIGEDGALVVAERSFVLEPTLGYQAYLSDAAGCPRNQISPDEDLYLTFRGPLAPKSARVFLVADRPSWNDSLPLLEAREEIGPNGQLLSAGGGSLGTLLLWPADPKGTRSGYYALVVRTDLADDRPLLATTDRLLSHLPPGGWRSTEEGVRINDWDCGPPQH